MPEYTTVANEALTHEEARAVFERIFGLLNEHDVRHIPTVFTEDVTFEDDAWPEPGSGPSTAASTNSPASGYAARG